MDAFLSVYNWLSQYVHPGTALSIIITFLVLYKYWLAPILTQTIKATADIQKVASTIADEKGNPILSYKALADLKEQIALLRDDFDEHSKNAEGHYDEVKRTGDLALWQKCDVGKCPNLGNITAKLDHVIHIFDTWDDKAEQSRQNAGATLDAISSQIRDCSNELKTLAKTVIEVLSNAVLGNNKRKTPNDR